MASRYEVTDEGHVGGQEQVESEWKTIRAVFHNFASLPSKRGDVTRSPVLECHGFKWKVVIIPGGDTNSKEDEVYLSIFLKALSCSSTKKIKAKSIFRIPSAGTSKGGGTWDIFGANEFQMWGQRDYKLRSLVLKPSNNFLVGGNLTVEVDIQVMLDKLPTWTPTNTVCSDMLKLLESADADENADLVFEIGDSDKAKTRSKQGDHQAFRAHKAILSIRCPTLALLADGCDSESPITIEDVHPDIFRMLLRFVYGGEVPEKAILAESSKTIIRAADRFGCTGLKLAAEAELATANITTENAAELILFADATNCAMLKEAAMDYFVKNVQDVMASDGYEQVAESPAIMREMMAAMAFSSKKRPAPADSDGDGRDYKRMRVASLRQKLDEKGLDVDGSKEMLVSRLEEAENDVY